jgi:hypothetical protein
VRGLARNQTYLSLSSQYDALFASLVEGTALAPIEFAVVMILLPSSSGGGRTAAGCGGCGTTLMNPLLP